MAFDAINESGDSSYVYPNWITLLSGDDQPPVSIDTIDDPEGEGAAASLSTLQTGLSAISVSQNAGSAIDSAELEWALTGHLINRTQPAQFARMVEVRLPDLSNTRLHLGDYVTEVEKVGETEVLTATSQTRDYLFGKPFEGQVWWNAQAKEQETVPIGPRFNPIVDGQILNNKSDKDNEDEGATSALWIHPEAARTTAAENFSEQEPEEWILSDAIRAMCDLCNPDEEFITNPSSNSFNTLTDAPALRDVKLPVGKYLPFYLDQLLQPLGYNWHLDYAEAKPEIVIWQKGVGEQKTLPFQAPGEVLDLNESHCNEYEVNRDIGDSINACTIIGDMERYELTIPLYPTWAESKDELSASGLNKQSGSDYEGNEHVHRKWAANEAGDYDGLRSDDLEAVVPDWSDIFTKYVPHRRTLQEPLTYAGDPDDPQRRPVFVEYSTDGGATRQELTDDIAGNLLMLPDELGLLFNSDEPPTDLIDAGTDARIYITGTVCGDSAIEGKADPTSTAVNGRENRLVLEQPQKYVFRKVLVESGNDFRSSFADLIDAGSVATDERDDTEAIQEQAEKLRDLNEVAEVRGRFELPGWHLQYKISDILTDIEGRDVTLNAAPESGTARYTQITGVVWMDGDNGPQTRLTVERGDTFLESSA